MHDYNDEYASLLEHAYNFQPTDSATITLISSYIQRITNPHIRSKLRTARANILQDIFVLALEEDQKHKVRSLDFDTEPDISAPVTSMSSKAHVTSVAKMDIL